MSTFEEDTDASSAAARIKNNRGIVMERYQLLSQISSRFDSTALYRCEADCEDAPTQRCGVGHVGSDTVRMMGWIRSDALEE